MVACRGSPAMRVQFDSFILDSESRELLKDGVGVPLSPKALQLLLFLVEHRPRALSKAVLHAHLWPETFVVDANLTNLVAEARAALGDDPRRPRYLRTLHRFGYAFCADATEKADSPGSREFPHVTCTLTWRKGRVNLSDGTYVLGREPGVAIRVPFPSVSRRHAHVHVAGGSVTIEDLGSKNGTSIRGERLTASVRLADRDSFLVGSVRVTVHLVLPTASTTTVIGRSVDERHFRPRTTKRSERLRL
jgi:DNA-binding winged helix-turn-helix (wHTH) protein